MAKRTVIAPHALDKFEQRVRTHLPDHDAVATLQQVVQAGGRGQRDMGGGRHRRVLPFGDRYLVAIVRPTGPRSRMVVTCWMTRRNPNL